MIKHHVGLTLERWCKDSLCVQLANVGAEIDRIIYWRDKNDAQYSKDAFERMLELLSLTILDPKHSRGARRELTRTREALIDYFVYDNEYKTNDKIWQDYFYHFSYAAALERERRFKKKHEELSCSIPKNSF
jgi:hypothetical protein